MPDREPIRRYRSTVSSNKDGFNFRQIRNERIVIKFLNLSVRQQSFILTELSKIFLGTAIKFYYILRCVTVASQSLVTRLCNAYYTKYCFLHGQTMRIIHLNLQIIIFSLSIKLSNKIMYVENDEHCSLDINSELNYSLQIFYRK